MEIEWKKEIHSWLREENQQVSSRLNIWPAEFDSLREERNLERERERESHFLTRQEIADRLLQCSEKERLRWRSWTDRLFAPLMSGGEIVTPSLR